MRIGVTSLTFRGHVSDVTSSVDQLTI